MIIHVYHCLFLSLLLRIPGDGAANHAGSDEDYRERLIIRSLDRGKISAHFQFRTFVHANLDEPFRVNAGRHSDIFPLSILRALHMHEVQELNFSLTKGLWKYDQWGLPPRDVPPNAHLRAWFRGYQAASKNWNKLTSFLSGQFCASVNLINPTITIRPKASFGPFLQPAGQLTDKQYGFVAALPQEAICTENFTPWIKLLPCRSKKGLGQLLLATNVFNSQFISMSLDFKFTCSNLTNCDSTRGIELTQNIMIVFNAPMILDGRYSWTFSSLFSRTVQSHCSLSRSTHVYIETTHLGAIVDAKLSAKPNSYVRIDHTEQAQLSIRSAVEAENRSNSNVSSAIYADYDIGQIFSSRFAPNNSSRAAVINAGITYPATFDGRIRSTAFDSVSVRRQACGYGLSSGGITTTIVNRLPHDVFAIYLDAISWHFRIYLQTMKIESRPLGGDDLDRTSIATLRPRWMHYEPGRDRERPHHLEMLLRLPARSQIEIRYEFEQQFLRWTEFLPDANHGMYINPATVTVFLRNSTENYERFLPQFFAQYESSAERADRKSFEIDELYRLLNKFQPLRLFTGPILISMPTPDFSMLYNVVCLVSTVLSIAFGPIYNITTRRTSLIDTSKSVAKDSAKSDNGNADDDDDDRQGPEEKDISSIETAAATTAEHTNLETQSEDDGDKTKKAKQKKKNTNNNRRKKINM